jgi:HK97 family phage major capsid protein
MSEGISETIEALGKGFEEFKATHEREIAEIKSKGAPDPLTVEKLAKIESTLSGLEEIKKRLEAAEIKLDRPGGRGAKAGEWTPAQKQHVDAFAAWFRNPKDHEAQFALKSAAKEAKAVSSSTASAGYAIPEVIAAQIEAKLQQVSPMRRILGVRTVGSSDYKELVNVRGTTTGWVGETDSRTATSTPALEEAVPTFGEVYAYASIYNHVAEDAFFNVGAWLQSDILEELAIAEGEAWISGNGTKKPTGFLNGSPSSAGDFDSPARAFQTLEYVPTGVAYDASNPFGVLATSSPTFFPQDVFMDTIHAMRPGYRAGALWVMNTATKGEIRKLKDNEGNYLLRMGLETGEGNSLLGYRIEEMDGMPDMGTNAYPIAFGNFGRGYVAAQIGSIRLTIDDNITSPGQVKFYMRERVGGIVKNDDAIKLVKMAAS